LFDLTEFERVLKPTGTLITTVVDTTSSEYFVNKRIKEYGSSLTELDTDSYVYFFNNDAMGYNKTHIPAVLSHFITIYNIDWLRTQININKVVRIPNHQVALVINF
jgi:hypothetical protein